MPAITKNENKYIPLIDIYGQSKHTQVKYPGYILSQTQQLIPTNSWTGIAAYVFVAQIHCSSVS